MSTVLRFLLTTLRPHSAILSGSVTSTLLDYVLCCPTWKPQLIKQATGKPAAACISSDSALQCTSIGLGVPSPGPMTLL